MNSKSHIIAVLVFLMYSSASVAQQLPAGSRDFNWLIGEWKRTDGDPGTDSYERWGLREGQLSGLGVTLNGKGDTTFVEDLAIEMIDGVLYYVAVVSHNKGPVYFGINECRQGFFRCSNPEHDFPKEITYELMEKELTVAISGNGKVITFSFEKLE